MFLSNRSLAELLIIVLVTVIAAFVPVSLLPIAVTLGGLCLAGAVLLLGQGLLRDAWILWAGGAGESCALPESAEVQNGRKPATCMCMESTIGTLLIVVGIALLFTPSRRVFHVGRGFWTLFVGTTLVCGLLMKSIVIDWKAKRLRIVRDHKSVVFW